MKVHSILSILDKKELSKLKKYLNSEFFCSDPKQSKMLSLIIKASKFSTEIDKSQIWQDLYPQVPYDDVKMRLLLSRLFQHIENFIQMEHLLKDNFNLGQLKLYRHKSKDKLFLQVLNEQKTQLTDSTLRNELHFEREYSLGLEEYDYLVTKKRQGEFNLKNISDSIEISYAIKKLRHCCRVLQIHSIYKLETPFPFIEEILKHIELNKWYEIPVLGFYYFNYQSIINPANTEHFNQCVNIYNNYEDQFEEEERRYAYIDILNYCIRKLNEGSEQYYDTIFNLYNRGLTKGFLIDQGKLSRFTYRNIAEIGILMKEYNWVLNFLEAYKKNLDKQYQESFYLLEKARVLSDQRQYNDAIALLLNLNFSDPLIELSTRLERIRIFFEMNEIEICQYHVESMELFLRRKKFLGYHTAYYKNFMSYTRKLLKPENNDIKHWKQLRQQIEKEEKITGRKWLIEKFEAKLAHSLAAKTN
ncbi:MAG: hypothetical protein ABI851_00155 [Saprospiraceae bacterium]